MVLFGCRLCRLSPTIFGVFAIIIGTARLSSADPIPVSIQVVIMSPFDRNPLAQTVSERSVAITEAIVEVRPSNPIVRQEMKDAVYCNVDWTADTYRADNANRGDSFPNNNCTVKFTADPTSIGAKWMAKVGASFQEAGYWDVYLHARLSFYSDREREYAGEETSGGPLQTSVQGYGPVKIVSTGRQEMRLPRGHNTTYTMEVVDNANPPGRYSDGTPQERFLTAIPLGYIPNVIGADPKGDTWARGSIFTDNVSWIYPNNIPLPPAGTNPPIGSFDQLWRDIRVRNPADNLLFRLNTQHIKNYAYSSTRND